MTALGDGNSDVGGGMDWFAVLLAITIAIRGLGAGLIYDVALVSLPVRRRIGATAYARFARALFEGGGARTYAPVAILGALLTLAVAIAAMMRGEPRPVTWAAAFSVLATVIAFIGTLRALPAMLNLRQAPDDEAGLEAILDRFARWHGFSALWQVIAFLALVTALALRD